MNRIKDTAELMEILCSAAGTGAHGAGEVTILPKGGGGYARTRDGAVVKITAVVSAGGYCGRSALIRRIDNAAERLRGFGERGILSVRAPFPAVMAQADDRGFMLFEREIEIIYAGVV